VSAREAARQDAEKAIAANDEIQANNSLSTEVKELAADHAESAKAVLENAKANADAARKAL